MPSKHSLTTALVITLLFVATDVAAQNTGGVFGPVVDAGHRSLQYRIGHDPDSGRTAQRLHYQQAIDGERMWRVIAQTSERGDGSLLDFDFVQGELFWQLTDDNSRWQQGLRFDLKLRDSGRPGTVGVNWMNQFPVNELWRARVLVLTSTDFGDNAADGVFLQTRGQLVRPLDQGRQIGLEMYSAYGALDDLASLDDQRHQLGPFLTTPGPAGLTVFASALFGLTDGSPDVNLALWLTRRF